MENSGGHTWKSDMQVLNHNGFLLNQKSNYLPKPTTPTLTLLSADMIVLIYEERKE